MKNLIQRFIREEDGQDLIEYALLAAIIAIGAILGMQAVSSQINSTFTARRRWPRRVVDAEVLCLGGIQRCSDRSGYLPRTP